MIYLNVLGGLIWLLLSARDFSQFIATRDGSYATIGALCLIAATAFIVSAIKEEKNAR